MNQNSLSLWSKQNSLTPKGNNNLNFQLARDQVVLFDPASLKPIDFFIVFFYFWIGRCNKTLNPLMPKGSPFDE